MASREGAGRDGLVVGADEAETTGRALGGASVRAGVGNDGAVLDGGASRLGSGLPGGSQPKSPSENNHGTRRDQRDMTTPLSSRADAARAPSTHGGRIRYLSDGRPAEKCQR
jgi:hypothetical protein